MIKDSKSIAFSSSSVSPCKSDTMFSVYVSADFLITCTNCTQPIHAHSSLLLYNRTV